MFGVVNPLAKTDKPSQIELKTWTRKVLLKNLVQRPTLDDQIQNKQSSEIFYDWRTVCCKNQVPCQSELCSKRGS